MLDFAHPWALLLLPLAPAILWVHHRRPRFAVRWPGAAELFIIADRWSERILTLLWALAVLSGVLALAGPRTARAGDRIEADGIAIMLIVDVSGSMAEPDFDWHGDKITRLDALKRSFQSFVKRRPQDRLGLILFAVQPDTACPLTMDHAALLHMLNAAEPRGVPTESETNLGDALAWGVARIQTEHGRKTIVLCSDGEHNVPAPALMPRQAAQLAAAAGIPVDTLFAGPPNGPGRDGLQAIARMTGGTAMEAHDADALDAVCNSLDQLERDRCPDPRRLKYHETYPWFALAAAGLVTAALAYTRGPGRVMP
jgi:Ca-activated chloride channel family protein